MPEKPSSPMRPRMSAPMPASHSGVSAGGFAIVALVVLLVLGGGGFAFWYFVIRMPPVTPAPIPSVPSVPSVPSMPQNGSNGSGGVTVPPASTTETSEPTPSEAVLPAPVTQPPPGVNIPAPTSVTDEPPSAPPTPPAATSTQPETDSDADGLSDRRESELGLDPANPDSDGDTLTDGDEVIKYGTNPLNRDTDKDGFEDGSEVRNGYSPRGAGKCATPDCVAS